MLQTVAAWAARVAAEQEEPHLAAPYPVGEIVGVQNRLTAKEAAQWQHRLAELPG